MNRKGLVRLAGVAMLCGLASLVAAQALEIIPLRHRTADQVLPALQPLLEPGGTLSAHGNQLIVRTSPENLAELRRALEAVDRPARRLQISVRYEGVASGARRELGASASVDNRGARVVVTGQDTGGTISERVDQRLLVLDGAPAMISGFEVVPRAAGSQVTLDIATRRETRDSFQRAATTLTTRMGAWTEIGATTSQRIWVKVEEARN